MIQFLILKWYSRRLWAFFFVSTCEWITSWREACIILHYKISTTHLRVENVISAKWQWLLLYSRFRRKKINFRKYTKNGVLSHLNFDFVYPKRVKSFCRIILVIRLAKFDEERTSLGEVRKKSFVWKNEDQLNSDNFSSYLLSARKSIGWIMWYKVSRFKQHR